MIEKIIPAVSLLCLTLASGTAAAATVTQIPVTEVQSGGVQRGGYSQSGQSELLLLVQQLQEEVRQLRGVVETQQHKIDRMEREQRDRYRDIDRRVSALITAAANDPMAGDTSATGSVAPDDASAVGETPVPAPSESVKAVTSAGQTGQTGQLGDQEAYQSAFQLVRERKFSESKAAFEQFISDYPNSRNAANAYYWIGEIDLAQQSLESAKNAFKRVVDQYPQHAKVPDAMYKLGVVEDRLGNIEAARQAFQRLIELYPQSSAAGLARNYSSR
ncbi:TPR repeat containing exported protein [Marinobacterium lacunae]|uniref:Cell division coordinator CpoB n=1 Tax=Marinobacterium lacunae TaxID=1232683 RepID=A0A081FU48_9GAMM|nr:tol-pal system protein YbgF [Marinobacterium lacunae]KEA62053.1 TPR repeat containing exported protein [Marinobacterium lacunae]